MKFENGRYIFESMDELYATYMKEKRLNQELEARLSELSIYEGILRNRLSTLTDVLQQELADVESRLAAIPKLHSSLLYEEELATQLPYMLSEESVHLSVMRSKLEQLKSELDREVSYKRILDGKGVIDTGYEIAKRLKTKPAITLQELMESSAKKIKNKVSEGEQK